VNLTYKRASPFSGQIHRTRWLSLPDKVVVAEHTKPHPRNFEQEATNGTEI
jgi:hypothetical protein